MSIKPNKEIVWKCESWKHPVGVVRSNRTLQPPFVSIFELARAKSDRITDWINQMKSPPPAADVDRVSHSRSHRRILADITFVSGKMDPYIISSGYTWLPPLIFLSLSLVVTRRKINSPYLSILSPCWCERDLHRYTFIAKITAERRQNTPRISKGVNRRNSVLSNLFSLPTLRLFIVARNATTLTLWRRPTSVSSIWKRLRLYNFF